MRTSRIVWFRQVLALFRVHFRQVSYYNSKCYNEINFLPDMKWLNLFIDADNGYVKVLHSLHTFVWQGMFFWFRQGQMYIILMSHVHKVSRCLHNPWICHNDSSAMRSRSEFVKSTKFYIYWRSYSSPPSSLIG